MAACEGRRTFAASTGRQNPADFAAPQKFPLSRNVNLSASVADLCADLVKVIWLARDLTSLAGHIRACHKSLWCAWWEKLSVSIYS